MDTERIVREIGLAEALMPRAALRQMEAVGRVINPTGDIDPRKADPFRTPRYLDYAVGTTPYQRAGRAGTLALVSVRCNAAPSTGDATIMVTIESQLSGAETYPVTVPKESATWDEVMAVPVNATDWIGVVVTTPSGASGVSASLTISLGGA